MSGRIILAKRYTRAEIRANRDKLYVFGDNVSTLGRGGQAKECRGEPNTVGIPTKWHPTTDEGAYFTDDALAIVKPRIQEEFRTLQRHLLSGGDVVWPSDGVGTGLAQLDKRAPAVAEFIDRCLRHLRDRDGARSAETRSGSGPHQDRQARAEGLAQNIAAHQPKQEG